MTLNIRRLSWPLLWLVALNLLPAFSMRPLWASIFCAVLVGYRFWLYFIDAKMPPRWVMFIGQITVAIAVWQHYFSLFGDEAAGTFLTLLLCLKAYELRTQRDLFMTALLCFLVLMSELLLDQSLIMTVFLFVDVGLLVAYLFTLEDGQFNPRGWRAHLGTSLLLTLKALPLVVAIFVLFPRFSTGFGTGPNTQGKMGVTDTLRPGTVSNLIKSDELVFRATFLKGEMPARPSLYWRGAILDVSQGINWDRSKEDVSPRPPPIDNDGEIEIYLETGFEKFLFSLENTRTISFPRGTRIHQREGETFELDQPLQTRERYWLHARNSRLEEKNVPAGFLKVNRAPSAQLKAFLDKMNRSTTAATVSALLDHFRRGGFSYTLEAPQIGSLEEFLFITKRGFCEHYAGSMATLLRYLNIPARVVVGFQGGTPSLLENFVTVRAHDAHAWVEYYDNSDKRWHRNDPTAQVDPQRLVNGADAYRPPSAAWVPPGFDTVFGKARALFDEVDASWTGFLLRFDLARQKEMLARLGMEGTLFRALPVFLVLAIILILAVLYYLEASRRTPLNETDKMYYKLMHRLRRAKLERRPNEGPREWLERLEQTRPETAVRLSPILTQFALLRYGGQPFAPETRDQLRAQIRRLSL